MFDALANKPSVTLGLTYSPNHPEQYDQHAWWGFAAVFAVNILGLAVIIARRDIVWAVAATWICVSEWSARPKPLPVLVRGSVLFFPPLVFLDAILIVCVRRPQCYSRFSTHSLWYQLWCTMHASSQGGVPYPCLLTMTMTAMKAVPPVGKVGDAQERLVKRVSERSGLVILC